MCGIAGIYSQRTPIERKRVEGMLEVMAHRGPDDRGLQALEEGRLLLGHLRLSILDLSALGHQPMSSPDGKVWIVYNGEVYNYREIRHDLVAEGWGFRSDSDTEVILAAYCAWGLDAIERFRGMFAFAIWDGRQRLLHLCRDRFGVKPLYFSVQQGELAFASEMKGLIRAGATAGQASAAALAQFVQYGYITAPMSVFSDVQTVRPGTIRTFDEKLSSVERRYWSATDLYDGPGPDELRRELARLPEAELLERIEQSLQQAFVYRMVADVPVGLFLSGGIDSSLVAALLVKRAGISPKTFTIAFSGSEFDESSYARAVAATLGTEHTELAVSAQYALDAASAIVDIADEPIGDSSLIPTLVVSRMARSHVKVALSADGADELFGGYARYSYVCQFVQHSRAVRRLYYLGAELIDALPPGFVARAYAFTRRGGPRFAAINDKLRKFVRMSRSTREDAAYDAAVSEWPPEQAGRLVLPTSGAGAAGPDGAWSVRGAGPADRFMNFDLQRYLPGDLLVKVDRASMATSLEAREPFLDHEAAKLAAALPLHWKIRGRQGKFILRRLLERHFPPELFQRPKQGFSPPVAEWLRGPLRPLLEEQLSVQRVKASGLLDPEAANNAARGFLAGERSTSAASVWILLQVQQWANRWHTGAALAKAR